MFSDQLVLFFILTLLFQIIQKISMKNKYQLWSILPCGTKHARENGQNIEVLKNQCKQIWKKK